MILPRQLISQSYLDSQKAMHANPRGYGGRGDAWTATVIQVAREYQAFSILDYGAGQASLGKALRAQGWDCRDYDPAREGIDHMPGFADLVTCTDVLEHIEPHKLDVVLAHIRGLARKAVFFVVATRPANKILPSGKNAHLIIESPEWWQARVTAAGFAVQDPPTVLPAKMPGKCWMAVVTP